MTTHKSKIGRLPFIIREQLNQKLMDNVPTKELLAWLNTDPAVKHCMERLFENRQITEQNLSEWRQGGYQEWLDYNSCIDDVRDLSEDAARVALTDISGEHLLLALTGMFAQLIKKMDEAPEILFNRRVIILEDLMKMALSLRRSEQRDKALKLKEEQLELLREKQGHKSPSSCPPSPNETRASSSSNNLHSIPAHPVHSKAPEIDRPTPLDPNRSPAHPERQPASMNRAKTPPDLNEEPDPAPASGIEPANPTK